ncbi:hypothetical protein PGTUg99_025886 [Puccinia graminis f. sp. tritici]|uniref:Uncharacterized protein n=1 Tax=Puccinia graminis f. sp. tritici TaxID=56615 RepID=A0A5B0PJD7_PUCGR|nr:hypothetical protein PGTUg99_025886 [Puccinia graminis f. sp. tritici]
MTSLPDESISIICEMLRRYSLSLMLEAEQANTSASNLNVLDPSSSSRIFPSPAMLVFEFTAFPESVTASRPSPVTGK